nr:unnamed protein product [Callosobruchus analis]
MGIHNT